MKRILLFLGLITMIISCSEQGDCSGVSSNILKIGFYNFADRKAKSIALDSVKIEGSTLTFYKAETVPAVELPLHPESGSIGYLFYYGGSVVTLNVQYKIRTFALAPDCLAIDLYSILDASGDNTISQIFFTQKEINKNVPENIKLYF